MLFLLSKISYWTLLFPIFICKIQHSMSSICRLLSQTTIIFFTSLLKCATCVSCSRSFPILSGKLTNQMLSSWWRPMCEEKKFCLFLRFSAFSANIFERFMWKENFFISKFIYLERGRKKLLYLQLWRKLESPRSKRSRQEHSGFGYCRTSLGSFR